MRLIRASLTDFRNYDRLTFEPGPGLNVLTGPNGSGKTNLLEAISLLAPGRGLRNARPESLARAGATGWAVASRVVDEDLARELGTGTIGRPAGEEQGRGRLFRLDNASARPGEIATLVSLAWLTPQMERLFGEAATGRRRFLDRLVAALDTGHARTLAAHDASAANRKRLLAERRQETAWLRAAEDSLARAAAAVCASRLAFCRRMNNLAAEAATAFPAARLGLLSVIAERLESEPARLVEDWIRDQLATARDTDAATGLTSVGAHRCDLAIAEQSSGLPASLASTGQQKALLVGIVLAHAALVEFDRGKPPVLLLDEPLVHLDETRRSALFDVLAATTWQVLLTGTDATPFASLAPAAAFWHVGEGAVRPAPKASSSWP